MIALPRRLALAGGAALLTKSAKAANMLRIGDQKGGYKSLMAVSGALKGFEDHVEWSLFPAASPLLEALNAGAIDGGGVGDAPFAFARAAGVRAKIILATRSAGTSTALLVPEHANFRSFADLKGRTIGTGKGSIGHYLTIVARGQAGLASDDIKLAFLSPADAKAAFVSGAIDAWSTWGQYVYLAVVQNKARILLDGGKGLMSGLSYFVASEKTIAEKHELLLEFKRRLDTALRWGLANTGAYAQAWADETGVPLEVSRMTLEARGFSPVPIDAGVIADQQHTVEVYAKEGVLPRSYDVTAGFDPAFNG
jgi:sulfonate transport system substrate-binding protein